MVILEGTDDQDIYHNTGREDLSESEAEMLKVQFGDAFLRLKAWALNYGAHRIGRMSLDYRLREVTSLHNMVAKLLEDVVLAINEGMCMT